MKYEKKVKPFITLPDSNANSQQCPEQPYLHIAHAERCGLPLSSGGKCAIYPFSIGLLEDMDFLLDGINNGSNVRIVLSGEEYTEQISWILRLLKQREYLHRVVIDDAFLESLLFIVFDPFFIDVPYSFTILSQWNLC